MIGYLFILSLFSSYQVSVQEIPAPPIREYEFFGPTRRTHSLLTECGMNKTAIGWTFNEAGVKFTKFQFHEREENEKDLNQLNSWVSELRGDIFVIVSCGNYGVNVAMAETSHAGVRPVRQIRTMFDGERFKLVSRVNF
jgi:hypothetical protein